MGIEKLNLIGNITALDTSAIDKICAKSVEETIENIVNQVTVFASGDGLVKVFLNPFDGYDSDEFISSEYSEDGIELKFNIVDAIKAYYTDIETGEFNTTDEVKNKLIAFADSIKELAVRDA